MLTTRQPRIYPDGTSLIVYVGEPNQTVTWSVLSGPGSVTPLADATDSRGLAGAVYSPAGITGTAVIRCEHGA